MGLRLGSKAESGRRRDRAARAAFVRGRAGGPDDEEAADRHRRPRSRATSSDGDLPAIRRHLGHGRPVIGRCHRRRWSTRHRQVHESTPAVRYAVDSGPTPARAPVDRGRATSVTRAISPTEPPTKPVRTASPVRIDSATSGPSARRARSTPSTNCVEGGVALGWRSGSRTSREHRRTWVSGGQDPWPRRVIDRPGPVTVKTAG